MSEPPHSSAGPAGVAQRSALASVPRLHVHLPELLRDSAGGTIELQVEGDTLASAMRSLFERLPLLRTHLYEQPGKLRPHVVLFLNSENVARLPSLEVPIRDGDELYVLQAVSGG